MLRKSRYEYIKNTLVTLTKIKNNLMALIRPHTSCKYD